MIVGCTEFPPSKVGWAKDPTSKISTAGTYQVGTEVTLVCGMGYQNPPHPAKVKCLESGKWGDSVCTPDNNTISKAILGPSAGTTNSTALRLTA